MTDSAHEAHECLKLVLRGESVESVRALIAVSRNQQTVLRKTLGPQAELVLEYRRQVLTQFEQMLAEGR